MGRDANESTKRRKTASPWASVKRQVGAGFLADVPGLTATIDRVIATGDAVMFSRTGDGGAVVITLLAGNDRHKAYAADQDELDAAVARLAEAYAE